MKSHGYASLHDEMNNRVWLLEDLVAANEDLISFYKALRLKA